jgi:hypothetical protein
MNSSALVTLLVFAAPADNPRPDDRQRSLEAFATILTVLKSPRCSNCHPTTDVPLQGDERRLHGMGVTRGPRNRGGPVQQCSTCHQTGNAALANVPGAPHWGLAPSSMGWVGVSDDELARRLLDPRTNGGKTPAELVEHMANDPLVLWAWNPGPGRQPPPVPLDLWRKTLQQWLDTGAAIPPPPPQARP